MAIPSRKILVLGATGVIGKVILDALLSARDSFDRIGLFTSAETIANKAELIGTFKARGAEVVIGDLYSANDILEAYKGFDTVVSAVGRFAIDKQVDLIALAELSPCIIRFFPSEYGTDIAYNDSSPGERPHQKKLKVRAFIESDAIRRMTYTYLVTGPFANLYVGSMANEPQIGSFDAATRRATLLGDGKGRISLTTMADVGRSLVGALKHPDVCDGKAIKVNSFTTTPHEILAEFERQMGASWEADYTPLDVLRRLEFAAWEKDNPLAAIYSLRRIWTEGGTLYEKTDNESIGMARMDTLEMVVQEAIAKPTAGFQSGKM